MSLLRNAVKASRRLIRTVDPNQAALLRPILSGPTRHFSTDAQQPPNQQTPSSAEPFLHTPDSGCFYGRLSGLEQAISKHTLKSDILRMLDESNLAPEDLKINYNERFEPVGVMIQFPSRNAYEVAPRAIAKRGRLYRLDKVDRTLWDKTKSYDGKVLLLQGIPRNAMPEDIDRLLSDFEHDPSSIQTFFRRNAFSTPLRMAVVRFPNASLAMNAFINKNRSFCLSSQIWMQVLH